MKSLTGVILAGGLGTRLLPLTRITNKHLLPVHQKPMIYYPIEMMVEAGIRKIVLVTGGNHAGDFLRLLGNGHQFGLQTLNYVYQEGEGGIAHALGLVRHFVQSDAVAVMLGDNIYQHGVKKHIQPFLAKDKGASILLKSVPDPERFGVAEIKNGKVASIVEKPSKPKSSYAVTGFYLYDDRVFDVIRTLKPSSRGELEITDVNNFYAREGTLDFSVIKGWWSDCGTFDSLYRATKLVRKKEGMPV